MRLPAYLILAMVLGLGLAPINGATATKAQLVLAADAARPGDTVWAAVRLQMPARWHTYWRNPGESGFPTTIVWTLPAGITASDIQWPAPESYVSGGLTTFVYHHEAALLVSLQIAPTVAPGAKSLKAKVSWLECEEACVPGGAELEASLVVGSESKPSAQAGRFDSWRQRIPVPNPKLQLSAVWEPSAAVETRPFVIQGLVQDGFVPTDFYPYPNDAYEVAPAVTTLPADPGKFRLRKSVKRLETNFPKEIPGILVRPSTNDQPTLAFEATLTLPAAPGDTPARSRQKSAADASLLAMLGLAFLGGLILNIMPCVLPIIALKILGFVQQSKEAPQQVRKLGLIYAVGVLVSFLILAGMVIAVQQAGGAASWGMQMQNPYFRLVMTVVVILVALNLFGVFEVTLGGDALGAAAGLAAQKGGVGAFFNGVLATALATPCTAPFLAVALGFAFTQSALVILLIFTATALGLAAPYVLLSWQPAWLRFLPKPGAWMQRFKIAMGFPMLGTAVWLYDYTAPSFGESGGLWLGLFLVTLALAAWVFGEFVQRGRERKGMAITACCLLLGFGYAFALESQLHWRTPSKKSVGSGVFKDGPDGIEWHVWSSAAVDKARSEGHPVLVDFTAKWCPTCKANKAWAIEIPSVRAKLKEINAVAFRADNTDPDPMIAAELKRYERAGVPLVLVFPRQADKPALVLPTLLTAGTVLDALAQAVQ